MMATEQVADAKVDKTLVKGLAVLEKLSDAREPVKLTDLARDLGLTKSGVHRLLQTLLRLGYVTVREGGRYSATLKMWHLGSRIVDNVDSRQILYGFLQTLARVSMETVYLAALDGTDAVCIDKVEGWHSVRAASTVWSRWPSYCVATGKVHLAFRDPSILQALEGRMKAYTSRTITEMPRLVKELERVRRDGYAINRSEWEEDVCGLAAPIWDMNGNLGYAIGVTVPATRFGPADRERLADLVTRIAAEASAALGAPPAGDESRTAA